MAESYKNKTWLYQKCWIENLSSYKMAKFCNISHKKILIWMKKFNIKRRTLSEAKKGKLNPFYGKRHLQTTKEKLRLYFIKYKFNEKAFDILTPQATYWLGFIYADGCINPKVNRLTIALHNKDKIVLEKFKKFLNSNHPIYSYLYSDGIPKVELTVRSEYLINKLYEYGIHQNKAKTIRFPRFLARSLYPDFIRGYFDGDGSLYFRKIDKQWRFAIQSNVFFLGNLQKILIKNCNLQRTKFHFKKGTTSALMRYGGNKQVNRIINYLTQNEGFYLPRKIGRWLPRLTKT